MTKKHLDKTKRFLAEPLWLTASFWGVSNSVLGAHTNSPLRILDNINQKLKKTKVLISWDITATIDSAQKNAQGKEMILSRKWKWYSYYKLSNLSKTWDLDIYLKKEDWKEEKIILPDSIVQKIAEFIRLESKWRIPNGWFDCCAFCHFINKVPYNPPNFMEFLWDIDLINSEDNISIWDSIIISKKEYYKEITHFATYIWHWLYISLFGPGWKIIIISLSEMQKLFWWKYTYKIIPGI